MKKEQEMAFEPVYEPVFRRMEPDAPQMPKNEQIYLYPQSSEYSLYPMAPIQPTAPLLSEDERLARQLQAQYDQEASV
jgi:hypothetical protein